MQSPSECSEIREGNMKSILVLSLLLDVSGSGSMVMSQSPGTFTSTGNMPTQRSWHTATLLTNGKVLITGGSQFSMHQSLSPLQAPNSTIPLRERSHQLAI